MKYGGWTGYDLWVVMFMDMLSDSPFYIVLGKTKNEPSLVENIHRQAAGACCFTILDMDCVIQAR